MRSLLSKRNFLWVLYFVLLLVIFVFLFTYGSENRRRIESEISQGKQPSTLAPFTPTNGKDGRSAYQIWIDNGYQGSEMEFLSWLRGASGRDGRDGVAANGRDGRDGKDGRTPVKGVDYFDGLNGLKGDKGDKGDTGAAGTNGTNGTNGRTTELACILVTENNTDVRYYTAKYTDEPDSAYLTWQYRSRLPTWFVPNDCKDMRSV